MTITTANLIGNVELDITTMSLDDLRRLRDEYQTTLEEHGEQLKNAKSQKYIAIPDEEVTMNGLVLDELARRAKIANAD